MLDAKRLGVALVVVVNSALADNHQAELVQEIVSRGWAVEGKLGYVAFLLSSLPHPAC